MSREAEWKRLCEEFTRCRIAVVGDIILDRYLFGNVARISPEAPVPVLKVEKEEYRLGGAANVAANIASLGGEVVLAGVVGTDMFGRKVAEEWKGDSLIRACEDVNTVVKTRVIGQKQQIVRIDRETHIEMKSSYESDILEGISGEDISAIVVSDYAKGTLSESLMAGIKDIAGKKGVEVLVDPKPPHFDIYNGVTGITPNCSEAEQLTGMLINSDSAAIEAASRIKERFGCSFAIVTRGENGIAAIDSKGDSFNIPVCSHDVYDVTGAGDTVMAALALSRSAGAALKDSLIVANAAASIAIEKVGTSMVSAGELVERLSVVAP